MNTGSFLFLEVYRRGAKNSCPILFTAMIRTRLLGKNNDFDKVMDKSFINL